MTDELKELLKQRKLIQLEIEQLKLSHASLGEDIAALVEDGVLDKLAPKSRAKPKPKKLDLDEVAKKYADWEPAAGGCMCGCGEDTPEGHRFLRRHKHVLGLIVQAVDADKLSFDKIPVHARHVAASLKLPISGELRGKLTNALYDRDEDQAAE